MINFNKHILLIYRFLKYIYYLPIGMFEPLFTLHVNDQLQGHYLKLSDFLLPSFCLRGRTNKPRQVLHWKITKLPGVQC